MALISEGRYRQFEHNVIQSLETIKTKLQETSANLDEIVDTVEDASEAAADAVEKAETAVDTAEDAIDAIEAKATEVLADMSGSTEMEGMVAGVFSTSTSYKAGDYVIQAVTSGQDTVNKLFRFTADHAAGSWTGTDVSEVKLSGEVTDLKGALTDISGLIKNPLDIRKFERKQNTYINNSGEEVSLIGYDTYIIPCDLGSFVRISWPSLSGKPWGSLNNGYAIKLFDSNENISPIESSASTDGRYDLTNKEAIVIPSENDSKVTITVAQDAAGKVIVECGEPYELLDVDSNVDIRKTSRPISVSTAVISQFYFKTSTGATNGQVDIFGSTAKSALIPIKANDVVVFSDIRAGASCRAFFRANDGTASRIGTESGTTYTHTFTTSGILAVAYLADEVGDAIILPAEQINISYENVYGLDKVLEETSDALQAEIDDIEQRFSGEPTTYTSGQESGYYKIENGVITSKTSDSFTRSKIPVTESMKSVQYNIVSNTGINVDAVFCAFADANDDLILNDNHDTGEHDTSIPQNAAYIYLSFYGATYCDGYIITANIVVTDRELNQLGIENKFDGLSGVAFGTSLTYRAQTTYGYLQYLPDLSGITFDNQGIGSSYIYGNMLTAIKAYTGYAGKRVCLLEGFVNDWYNNKTLGTWKDNTETSVCGCVRSALNYMLSQNANLTIFLILDPYGRNHSDVDCSTTAVNGAGLTQFEYYEEIAKVAESLGIPVIKEYAESQISENTPQYLVDNIHPTALGAKQSANCIWSAMRGRVPNAVS